METVSNRGRRAVVAVVWVCGMARASVIGATPRITMAPVRINAIAQTTSNATARLDLIQDCRHACSEIVTPRHCENAVTPVRRSLLRDGDEQRCVITRIVLLQDGVITRPLGFESQPPPRGPDQRMEPVRRADDPRQAVRQKIPACNVLELVSERAPERRLVPLLERWPAG